MSDGDTTAGTLTGDELAAIGGRLDAAAGHTFVARDGLRLLAYARAMAAENARLRAALATVRGLLVMPSTRGDGGPAYGDPHDLQRVIDAALAGNNAAPASVGTGGGGGPE